MVLSIYLVSRDSIQESVLHSRGFYRLNHLRPQDVFKPVFFSPIDVLHEEGKGRGEIRSGRTAEDNSFTSFQTRPFK